MFLRILKKDLKRNKVMNIISFIFVILSVMLAGSSTRNIVSITSALDHYFEITNVPDYVVFMMNGDDSRRFEENFADSDFTILKEDNIYVEGASFFVNGEHIDYSYPIGLTGTDNLKTVVFDENDKKITSVGNGEIMLTRALMSDNGIEAGDIITVKLEGNSYDFKVAGSTKDSMYGGMMMGQTRALISQSDFDEIFEKTNLIFYMYGVCTENTDEFESEFLKEGYSVNFGGKMETIKTSYVMDMVFAAVMLIVSVCLLLISMLILRFTIIFTINEEYREIGVMKAIGIRGRAISQLYMVKYFAISFIGSVIGFLLCIPFGNMMMNKVSENMVADTQSGMYISVLTAVVWVALVMLFCSLCTRRINRCSAIEAIANAKNDERRRGKGVMSLSRSHTKPVIFLAINDIFSSLKRYISLIITFTLGVLLLIIPLNTVNTLSSGELIRWFSCTYSDSCLLAKESSYAVSSNRQDYIDRMEKVRAILEENGIEAEVHCETAANLNISHKDKKTLSLVFQGLGDTTTTDYEYISGTAPQSNNEIACTWIICDKLDVGIGDYVEIAFADGEVKEYIITALFQTMNNMGEGVRFYDDEEINVQYLPNYYPIQITYTDNPTSEVMEARQRLYEELFPEYKVMTTQEFVASLLGGISEQLDLFIKLIFLIVILINVLCTVLIVNNYIFKDRGEIGMLKSIGFRSSDVIGWQTLRIGVILIISILLGVALSTPLSILTSGQVFKFMGLQSIKFVINPLEVYVLYPLTILIVTELAAFITALQTRKIKASEISNIE